MLIKILMTLQLLIKRKQVIKNLKMYYINIKKIYNTIMFLKRKWYHLCVNINIERALNIFRGKKTILYVVIVIYFLRHYYLKNMLSFEFVFLILVLLGMLLVIKEYLDRKFRLLILKLVK